jgi:hypothetical protein
MGLAGLPPELFRKFEVARNIQKGQYEFRKYNFWYFLSAGSIL